MSEILWVAVPGGRAGDDQLLRVLVVPRLEPGSPADQGLGHWPPPELATGPVSIELATAPDATPVTHTATPRLATQPDLWEGFLGALEVRPRRDGPERSLQVAASSQHAEEVLDVYRASAAALPDADSQPAFHETVRLRLAAFADGEAPEPPRPPSALRPPEPPDFHQVVSLLREHPTVLRALGLVFDLTVPLSVVPVAAAGVVRVRWPDAPAGLPTIASPWSAYTRSTFLPAPAAGSDLVSGMVALARPVWRLHTIDVDSARGRLLDAARSSNGEGVGAVTLPSLRTAGVLLVRADREAHLTARRDTARANASRAAEDLPPLTAGDLALGYRVDVRVFGEDWHSLCRRTATYSLGTRDFVRDLAEEGHVRTRAAVDQGDGVLRMDEVVARWDGWSLAAPRPALDGSGNGAARPRATSLPFDFHWDIEPEAGTLLKLRFGQLYQLRARVADMAGGGRPLSDPSPDGCDSAPLRFARHEPVGSPNLLLPSGVKPSDLGPGGKLDLLVVRSGDGATGHPADRRRLLSPPVTTFDVVERHGVFDGDPDDTFPLADPHSGPLPDPAAEGVAVFLRPEPGGPEADIEPKDWVEPWPEFVAKTVTLKARDEAGREPTLDWTTPHELEVCLSPAEQVTLEVSSFVNGDRLAEFALNQWMPKASGEGGPVEGAVNAVVSGRHPMITPARAVTLVHAVRKPRAQPAGTFDAERAEGQTFVTLHPRPARLDVHTNSTAALQVSAAWDEVDDAGEAHLVTGAPVETLAVDRGDEELAPVRHELGDTKHRRITYTFTAISRFRQFFEGGTEDDFRSVGTSPEVVLPSSARPVPPVVRSVVPAFTWEESRDGAVITRRRRGGRVRVELARPWFTTGAGEALAVLVPIDDQPPAELWPFLTQRGRDPLWDTPVPGRWPPSAGDRVRLAENGVEVVAVPHPVWAFGDSRYADVIVDPDGSYSALAQLAVARYQPESLPGLELSPVVRTDWVPLLPDRTLTVDLSTAGRAVVTLAGLGPALPPGNLVEVIVERCTTAAPASTELVALTAAPQAPAWMPVDVFSTSLDEPVAVDLLTEGPLRLRVSEIELVGVAPGVLRGDTQLHDRTVFVDVVALP